MNDVSPPDHDVVVVTSRPAGAGRRAFDLEVPEGMEVPELPDPLAHEDALVNHMKEAGYRLTMVGGGSRPDEVRRFYFRPG